MEIFYARVYGVPASTGFLRVFYFLLSVALTDIR